MPWGQTTPDVGASNCPDPYPTGTEGNRRAAPSRTNAQLRHLPALVVFLRNFGLFFKFTTLQFATAQKDVLIVYCSIYTHCLYEGHFCLWPQMAGRLRPGFAVEPF